MKRRTIVCAFVLCWMSLTLCFAADNPNMGTWKLNEAKSKIPAGAPKNTSVVYTADGDNVKVVVDGVDGKGGPAHNEWTGKFDGKDYPVTGDPTEDTRAYRAISDRNLELVSKKNGKVSICGHIKVSGDGKTRTVTLTATDAAGKKITGVAVYDKQ